MPYWIDCECGRGISVELWDAGRKLNCPNCDSTVIVPSSIALKQMSGDAHPLAAPLERAAIALENREWPFSGQCQSCEQVPATMQVNMQFQFLIERFFDNDGGLQVGSSCLAMGEVTDAKWGVLRFPLLFCPICYAEYQRETPTGVLKSLPDILLTTIGMIVVLVVLLILAAILPVLSIPLAIVVFIRLLQFRTRKKSGSTVLKFVRRLRWIGEAVDREDEYTLTTQGIRTLSEPGVFSM